MAAVDARRPDLHGRIITTLMSAELALQIPLGVLRASAPDAWEAAGLALLHAHCAQTLAARLALPERAADDWSILPPSDCSGDLGTTLARFLSDPTEKRLEWPLAEAKRRAIHNLLERHELPVSHETQRSGRPYTLVLEKTRALFKRAADERREWANELAWLKQTATGFPSPCPEKSD